MKIGNEKSNTFFSRAAWIECSPHEYNGKYFSIGVNQQSISQ
jgi:hypothetical protein